VPILLEIIMKIYTIIASLFLLVTINSAQAEDFKHTETNTFIKHNDLTFGTRQNIGLDVQQYILRKDFKDTPYRIEYRNVHKGVRQEHWFRAQMKAFKHNGFFYNHRIEHRIREDKDNVFRYRPQFGYKATVGSFTPFIIFEPQWNYTYATQDKGYSHVQTFTGVEYKVSKHFTVAPYLEVDFDKSFNKDLAFFILDFKIKL